MFNWLFDALHIAARYKPDLLGLLSGIAQIPAPLLMYRHHQVPMPDAQIAFILDVKIFFRDIHSLFWGPEQQILIFIQIFDFQQRRQLCHFLKIFFILRTFKIRFAFWVILAAQLGHRAFRVIGSVVRIIIRIIIGEATSNFQHLLSVGVSLLQFFWLACVFVNSENRIVYLEIQVSVFVGQSRFYQYS